MQSRVFPIFRSKAVDDFRIQAIQGIYIDAAIRFHVQGAMHLGGGILSGLAVVMPPNDGQHLHAAVRPCRRSIVFEHPGQNSFERLGIGIAEACSLCQLRIDAAIGALDAVVHAVLHAHSV